MITPPRPGQPPLRFTAGRPVACLPALDDAKLGGDRHGLVVGLEQLRPALLATASRTGRFERVSAVRVSAAVSLAAEPGQVVVAVSSA